MEWNVTTIEPDRIQTSYHDDGAPLVSDRRGLKSGGFLELRCRNNPIND
jgi:hypothetical protein